MTLNYVVLLYLELAFHCEVALQCAGTLFSELALHNEGALSGYVTLGGDTPPLGDHLV